MGGWSRDLVAADRVVRGQRPGDRLAELVRSERLRRRWTQDELALKAGISRDTLSGIETGRARLGGRAVGSVLQLLDISEGQLGEIYGDSLGGTRYQHCLSVESRSGFGLSGYIYHLQTLSDDGLLEEVGHDPRPSHRMAYLDAIECRWCTYEALATNRLPLQFRDDCAIEEAAHSLVGDPGDRETYVAMRRAYRDRRWDWLRQHPTRRQQQVVISASGLTDELRALHDKPRAEQVVADLCEAVVDYQATFTLLVVDMGTAGVPEVEVVSSNALNLVDTGRVVGDGRCTIAIQHLRQGPGVPPTDYDLAVHFDPPFVEQFFSMIRVFWFSALGQYRLLESMTDTDSRSMNLPALTVTRLHDCLRLAYPQTRSAPARV
jgi:transcriptional regulator with XRE-family HTH domain